MFTIKFGAELAKLAIEGEGGLLGKIIEKKLESMGEDLIMDLIGGPMGTAQRVSEAVRTGGQSEFDRTRDEFLHQLQPRPLPHAGLIRKVGALFNATGRGRGRGGRRGGRPGSWQASSWAGSRQDWLQNHWHHDWRSQPRDTHGRWIPGRLDFVAAQLQYRGKRPGRTVLRRRKLRRLRKIATKRELRNLLKGNRDGY